MTHVMSTLSLLGSAADVVMAGLVATVILALLTLDLLDNATNVWGGWTGDNCDSCADGWLLPKCDVICDGFGCCNNDNCQGCIQNGRWVTTFGDEVHLTFKGERCSDLVPGKFNRMPFTKV